MVLSFFDRRKRVMSAGVLASITTMLLCGWCMPPVASAQDGNQRQAPIAGLPKGWLNSMRKRAANYVDFAGASFTLDEGRLGLLRIELDNRISDQWSVERDFADNPPPDPKDNSEAETQRFANAINAAYQKMPMNPERVIEWIVETIAVPAEAKEGRNRFLELCVRLDLVNQATAAQAESKVKLSRLFKSGRERSLKFGPDGVLVPAWQVQPTVKPQGLLLQLTSSSQPGESNAVMVRDDLPPPLPCLLDQDVWAASSAGGGQASDAKTYQLFQDCHFRMWWVLAGDKDVYKAATQADSNAALAAAIDRSGLRPQIDALLHELRCRVSVASGRD